MFSQVSPPAFADRVGAYFSRVHREVFAGDPAANPNLSVEVMGATTAHDTPVLVLIAPWTLCGLALPPDPRFPSSLRVGKSHYPALANEVEEIGLYWSVVLVPDVSGYADQEEARSAARALAASFAAAVGQARRESTQVADPDRRSLFKAVTGRPEPAPRESPFGGPDGPSSPTRLD